MARRVFLHIGPPKTGTSFLQAAWWQHRQELAEQGLLYPGDHRMAHFRAAAVLLGKSRVTERMAPAVLEMWQRLTDEVAAWDGDALISDEHFAQAGRAKCQQALDRLAEVAEEVHIVVTARDLARQVPAAWQQSVKQGNSPQTFDDYWRALATDPSMGFWKLQNLPVMLDRWSQDLPPERVHLVVHARPGAPKGLLWERTCGLLGVDPGILRPVARTNESLDVVQAELLRRVNLKLPDDRDHIDFGRLTKNFFTEQILMPAGSSDSLALSAEAQRWCVERGSTMVEELRERGYDVIGDLHDLVPDAEPRPGRTLDQVSDTELADLAAAALARFIAHEVAGRQKSPRGSRASRRPRRQVREAGARGRQSSVRSGRWRRVARRLRRPR